jgi:hypothetical protein
MLATRANGQLVSKNSFRSTAAAVVHSRRHDDGIDHAELNSAKLRCLQKIQSSAKKRPLKVVNHHARLKR